MEKARPASARSLLTPLCWWYWHRWRHEALPPGRRSPLLASSRRRGRPAIRPTSVVGRRRGPRGEEALLRRGRRPPSRARQVAGSERDHFGHQVPCGNRRGASALAPPEAPGYRPSPRPPAREVSEAFGASDLTGQGRGLGPSARPRPEISHGLVHRAQGRSGGRGDPDLRPSGLVTRGLPL